MRYLNSLWLLIVSSILLMPGQTHAELITSEIFLESKEVVATIYFDQGSSQLDTQSKSEIQEVVDLLSMLVDGGRVIRIEGFASKDGGDRKNLDLSLERALSVVDYLEGRGINQKLYLTGFGENAPERSDPTKTRRVEIATYENMLSLAKRINQDQQKVATHD